MKAARTRALNRKHAGTAKHGHTTKHTGTATKKAAKAHKQVAQRTAAQVKAAHARAWSPDSDVALCVPRAFAESLRLTGRGAVSHSAVLDVYWATAQSADAGTSILATADAILASGLAGNYAQLRPACLSRECDCVPVILGLDLPWGEPHAVVAYDGVWWSWGEPYMPMDFPGAVVEEAWAVTWR